MKPLNSSLFALASIITVALALPNPSGLDKLTKTNVVEPHVKRQSDTLTNGLWYQTGQGNDWFQIGAVEYVDNMGDNFVQPPGAIANVAGQSIARQLVDYDDAEGNYLGTQVAVEETSFTVEIQSNVAEGYNIGAFLYIAGQNSLAVIMTEGIQGLIDQGQSYLTFKMYLNGEYMGEVAVACNAHGI